MDCVRATVVEEPKMSMPWYSGQIELHDTRTSRILEKDLAQKPYRVKIP